MLAKLGIEGESKRRKRDKKKKFGNTRNRTCQTHLQSIMIHPKTVTIDASNAKLISPEKGSYQIMRKVNVKFSDDRI